MHGHGLGVVDRIRRARPAGVASTLTLLVAMTGWLQAGEPPPRLTHGTAAGEVRATSAVIWGRCSRAARPCASCWSEGRWARRRPLPSTTSRPEWQSTGSRLPRRTATAHGAGASVCRSRLARSREPSGPPRRAATRRRSGRRFRPPEQPRLPLGPSPGALPPRHEAVAGRERRGGHRGAVEDHAGGHAACLAHGCPPPLRPDVEGDRLQRPAERADRGRLARRVGRWGHRDRIRARAARAASQRTGARNPEPALDHHGRAFRGGAPVSSLSRTIPGSRSTRSRPGP
jgi:hypothetical protein